MVHYYVLHHKRHEPEIYRLCSSRQIKRKTEGIYSISMDNMD